MSITDKSVRL